MVSGDKKGQVAVWDHEKVHERTLYAGMHRALTNNLRFLCASSDAACASASSDGLLKACPPASTLFVWCRHASEAPRKVAIVLGVADPHAAQSLKCCSFESCLQWHLRGCMG